MAQLEARVNARKLSAVVFVFVTLAMSVAIFLLAVKAGRADHRHYYTPEGAVVYGDWGLYRPGHVVPWVEGPLVIGSYRLGTGAFFPTNRDDPGAYRRRPPEKGGIIPPEPYFRSWGAQSQLTDPRATIYAPFEPPAVIYAPRLEPHGPGKK
jgi:hypothetical protein